METRLSTKQVAALYNKHESTIRRWAESGKLHADVTLNKFNSPEYLFSVDALDPPQQKKYFYQLKASLPVPPVGILPERKASKPLDHYSVEERDEMSRHGTDRTAGTEDSHHPRHKAGMLRANGIGVIFEKENINTLTESSEFLITLFSGFAQAESESISKNVIWGIQKSREAGNVPFQYQKLLGYQRGADGQPEIVPEEAETVKRIFRRYLDGCSLGQIKAELEADHVPTSSGIQGWTYQVIHNILVNGPVIITLNQQTLDISGVALI